MPSLLFFPPPPDSLDPETEVESALWVGRRVYLPRPGGIIGIVTEVWRKLPVKSSAVFTKVYEEHKTRQEMQGANWHARIWWRDRNGTEREHIECTTRLRSVDRDPDHGVPWASRL